MSHFVTRFETEELGVEFWKAIMMLVKEQHFKVT